MSYLSMRLVDLFDYAANPETPKTDLVALSEHESALVREKVALNPSSPTEAIDKLSTDLNHIVSAEAFFHPNLSDVALQNLSNTPTDLAKKVVGKQKVTPEILEQLLNHFNPEVRKYALNIIPIPESFIRSMVTQSQKPVVLRTIGEKRDTPADVLMALSENKNWEVRQRVAYNLNTPVVALQKMCTDKVLQVRVAALKHPNLPTVDAIARISKIKTVEEILAASTVLNLPEEEYFTLIRKAQKFKVKHEENIALQIIAENPTVGLVVLETLLEADVIKTSRPMIAGNPCASPAMLKTIFDEATKNGNTNSVILSALAANPTLPPEMFWDMMGMVHFKNLYPLAANPNAPIDALHHLSKHRDNMVKGAAVLSLWHKDPNYEAWPTDWIEQHFNVKVSSTTKGEIVVQGIS